MAVLSFGVAACSLQGLSDGGGGASVTSSQGTTGVATSADAASSSSSGGAGGTPAFFDWAATFGNLHAQTTVDASPHLRAVRFADHVEVAADVIGSMAVGNGTVGQESLSSIVGWRLSLDEQGKVVADHLLDLGGTANQHLGALAVAPSGLVALAGYFGKGTAVLDASLTLTNPRSVNQGFVTLRDDRGALLQAWKLSGALPRDEIGDGRPFAAVFDGNGHLVVSGDGEGTLTVSSVKGFGAPCSAVGDAASHDAFVASLDTVSGDCMWLRTLGGAGDALNDTAVSLAVQGTHVIAGGAFAGTMTFGDATLTASDTAGFVATLRASDGHAQSAVSLGASNSGLNRVTALLADDPGALWMAGYYEQAAAISGPGSCVLPKPVLPNGVSTRGGFLARTDLDVSGKLHCVAIQPLLAQNRVEARALTRASDGKLFVSGFANASMTLDGDTATCARGESDAFVLAFPPALDALPRGLSFGDSSADAADALSPGLTPGSVLVAGSYGREFAELPHPADADFFVGELSWPATLACP